MMKRTLFIVLIIGISLSCLEWAPAGAESDVPNPEVRIKPLPVALQAYTFRNFTFFETLKKAQELGITYLQAYDNQPLGEGAPGGTFNYAMSAPHLELVKKNLRESGLSVVAYGVVNFDNTEEVIRKVFDFARDLGIRIIVSEPKDEGVEILERLVKEYGLYIAIHNHPQPSKFAAPETVLAYVKNLDERFGSCADNGHWMKGGLKGVDCFRMLKDRIWDVHLKDRSDYGTAGAEDVPLGHGKADIKALLEELTLQNYRGHITIEYEAEKDAHDPVPAVRQCLDHIKSVTYYAGYQELLQRDVGGYEKHGWNHYGPGHFELDQRTGILKAQGGMGLLWYSVKKFKDFVLELDYKCTAKNSNSGVFLRLPEVPVNDDYINHSFEIQIDDSKEGIHTTAAAYDAEAPKFNAASPAGEWNHYKITFRGKHLQVELNGKLVVDWTAEPRGKVRDFAAEGYIGLQNHDGDSPVYLRDIFVKELK